MLAGEIEISSKDRADRQHHQRENHNRWFVIVMVLVTLRVCVMRPDFWGLGDHLRAFKNAEVQSKRVIRGEKCRKERDQRNHFVLLPRSSDDFVLGEEPGEEWKSR